MSATKIPPPTPRKPKSKPHPDYKVEAVLRDQELVLFDDGSSAPVLEWTNLDGADCAKEVATVAIAMHEATETYAHIIIDGFEPEVWH
jgi:hypothetical protein